MLFQYAATSNSIVAVMYVVLAEVPGHEMLLNLAWLHVMQLLYSTLRTMLSTCLKGDACLAF